MQSRAAGQACLTTHLPSRQLNIQHCVQNNKPRLLNRTLPIHIASRTAIEERNSHLPNLADTNTKQPWYVQTPQPRLGQRHYADDSRAAPQSALFNFQSLLLVILLLICTCAYVHDMFPSVLDRKKDGPMGVFWKCARVGERLSPYISICCVGMAVS